MRITTIKIAPLFFLLGYANISMANQREPGDFTPRSDCVSKLGSNATTVQVNACVNSYFDDKDTYFKDKDSSPSNLERTNPQKINNSMNVYKAKCRDLGFSPNTEGFGKCVLQLSK